MALSVALIATVKNEAGSIHNFLESIERQTRTPDIVVIVDGGSTDGTWGELQAWNWGNLASLDTFVAQKLGNRSVGRNEAIRIAKERGAETIACCNVGVLEPQWFERIVAPFESETECVDVVAGGYRIDVRNARERVAALVTQYTPEEATERGFVSALSMAFRVEAWRQVGGFPEELDTSEDTVFVQRLRELPWHFFIEPRARILWRPNTLTLRGAYRTYKQFARTDKKAGVGFWQYFVTLLAYAAPLYLAAVGLPAVGIFTFVLWLAYRSRKAPMGVLFAVAADFGRIRGFWL